MPKFRNERYQSRRETIFRPSFVACYLFLFHFFVVVVVFYLLTSYSNVVYNDETHKYLRVSSPLLYCLPRLKLKSGTRTNNDGTIQQIIKPALYAYSWTHLGMATTVNATLTFSFSFAVNFVFSVYLNFMHLQLSQNIRKPRHNDDYREWHCYVHYLRRVFFFFVLLIVELCSWLRG